MRKLILSLLLMAVYATEGWAQSREALVRDLAKMDTNTSHYTVEAAKVVNRALKLDENMYKANLQALKAEKQILESYNLERQRHLQILRILNNPSSNPAAFLDKQAKIMQINMSYEQAMQEKKMALEVNKIKILSATKALNGFQAYKDKLIKDVASEMALKRLDDINSKYSLIGNGRADK